MVAKSWVVGAKLIVPLRVPWGFVGQPFLVSNIIAIIENNTATPVLHQNSNSETSNTDIKNNEIYYPKVTSSSRITTHWQLHLRIKFNPVM